MSFVNRDETDFGAGKCFEKLIALKPFRCDVEDLDLDRKSVV